MQIAALSAGIFCLTCWTITAWELQNNAVLSVPVAHNVVSSPVPAKAPATIDENHRFTAFIKQPLFRPDRQPLDWALINRSNESNHQETVTDLEKRYQLKGVSIARPEKTALIFDTETSETLTLNISENLSGWTLKLVAKQSVIFERQARQIQLFLIPENTTQKNPAAETLIIQQPKPLKAVSSVPEDDPYQ